MNAPVAEGLDHEIRAAVEDLRVLLEVRCCVDEPLELDDASHAIQRSQLQLDGRENVEPSEARERIALLGGEFSTEPTLRGRAVDRRGTLPRDEEQLPRLHTVRVVRSG